MSGGWRCLSGRCAAMSASAAGSWACRSTRCACPLCHEPAAEAEVDWGEAMVVLAGVLTNSTCF